jgi:hypothetical protein
MFPVKRIEILSLAVHTVAPKIKIATTNVNTGDAAGRAPDMVGQYSTAVALADDGVCVGRLMIRLVQIRSQNDRRDGLPDESGETATQPQPALQAGSNSPNCGRSGCIKIWLRSDLAALDYMLFFAVFSRY